MKSIERLIKQWAAPVLCDLVIFLLFKFVFFIGYIPSESMKPTIKSGSCIAGYRIVGEIRRGDIFVFKYDGYMLVKRVAAVPGDTIYIDCTGVVSVNEETPDAADILTVPDGCYYMLGDNSENSIDSRLWEEPFIGKTQIVAKVLLHSR